MTAFKLGLKVAAVASLSALLSVSAMAGITNSKHDLRDGATGGGTTIAGATEICVFCHTPHGSNTGTSAPLWNRVITGTASTTAYSTSTLDGKAVLSGSPSLACLSCHDGSQAMNTVINAPSNENGYNYEANATLNYIGTASSDIKITAASNTFVANLGQDLRNDHPVAVPYAGGDWSAFDLSGTQSAFSAAAADPDFTKPATGTIGDGTKWWIDTETVGDGRQKTDLILYNRDAGTDIDTGVGYVECATCHDPHAGENQSFLRMTNGNQNSQVCLACHIK